MTVRDLEVWLTELLPIEECCKSFYLENGNITIGDYYRLKSKTSRNLMKDHLFLKLDNTYGSAGSLLNKYGTLTTFYNDPWFKDDSILVRKHTRYFPEVCYQMQSISLCYMMSGQCKKTVQFLDRTETLQLEAEDICILPPMILQSDQVYSDEGIMLHFSIRQDILASVLDSLLPDSLMLPFFSKVAHGQNVMDYLVLSAKGDKNIKEIFLTIALEYCLKKRHWEKIIMLQLGLIFSYLQRSCLDTCRFSPLISNEFDYIPGFLNYIQYHFSNFSLKEMSAFFHLSPNYICKLYKKQMGTTITQTLQMIRESKAKSLLKTTDFSVRQIGEMVGYEDTTYFIRMFKEKTGVTPLQYRKKQAM